MGTGRLCWGWSSLPMSVGLGWGRLVFNSTTTCTQVPRPFNRSFISRSGNFVCLPAFSCVRHLVWSVQPGPISHLAETSAIPVKYFSGRDLGTFWPGIGRDEPPCRIQSVIWYLVLHTLPRVAQVLRGTYRTPGSSSPNLDGHCPATPCQVPQSRHSIVPRSLF